MQPFSLESVRLLAALILVLLANGAARDADTTPPPVNIGHIQWLDMHDWKERRTVGGAAWKQWYQAKLAGIVRVVESEETR